MALGRDGRGIPDGRFEQSPTSRAATASPASGGVTVRLRRRSGAGSARRAVLRQRACRPSSGRRPSRSGTAERGPRAAPRRRCPSVRDAVSTPTRLPLDLRPGRSWRADQPLGTRPRSATAERTATTRWLRRRHEPATFSPPVLARGRGRPVFRSRALGATAREVGPVDDVLVVLLTSQVCGYYTAYGERAPVPSRLADVEYRGTDLSSMFRCARFGWRRIESRRGARSTLEAHDGRRQGAWKVRVTRFPSVAAEGGV